MNEGISDNLNADSIIYDDITGAEVFLGDFLREGYIRVKSRDELVAAVNYVNTNIKKATEIRLSKAFEPWIAPQTDIDLAWVSLVGEGGVCTIDATSIPDVDGNYWLRLYNSGASSINNIGNIYTDKIRDIFCLGPGATSNVDAIIYHNPTRAIASFTTRSLGTMGFRTGDSYRQNAYIIKHWGRSITRCTNHIWMPSGYSNYGEAIEYHASTISTSSGTGIRNDNADGAIRVYGGSLDYMGRIIVVTAGRVETYGTYIEFNNNSNKLNGIPFETSGAETAKISLMGGGIRGYITPLPDEVTTIFKCGDNTNGIGLSNMELMNIVLPTGFTNINSGKGKFQTTGIDIISGGGNPRVPLLKSDTHNLISDPELTQTEVVDWYISSDTGALTSRTSGENTKLSKDTSNFRTNGTASLKISKALGVGTSSEIQINAPISANMLTMYTMFIQGVNLTGNINISAYYCRTIYNNQIGIPIASRVLKVGPTRTIDSSTISEWIPVTQQSARNYTPEWATELIVKISLNNMSSGNLYVADAKITEL